MKIRDIYIDGFGIFKNRSLREISPHLTIILGDNESGKSTLLAFIRRVLFGFPSRRKGVNHYEPLNGGEQGGRIGVTTDSGSEYEVSRYEKKGAGLQILDAEGGPAGNAIAVIAGGADQAFFENVFAFGLGELESFDTLSDDAVQNRLMSAGAGVTKIPVPDVQKQLDMRIEGYYKKGTRKPRIAEILRELSETETTLSTISATQDEYDSLSAEEREVEAEIERLTAEKRKVERDIRRNENIIQVWDEWVAFSETEEILASLMVPESFPDNGVHQLDMVDAEIKRAEEHLRERTIRLEEEETEAGKITLDEEIFCRKEDIRTLEKRLPLCEADRASLPEINAEYAAAQKAFNTLLMSIDPRWTAETLLRFDISIPAQHRVLHYQKRQVAISEQKTKLRTTLQQYELSIRSENEATERYSCDLKASVSSLSEEKLQAQEHALVELAIAVPALDQKKRDLSSLLEEEAKRAENFREKAALARANLPLWPGFLMAGAAVAGLAIGYFTESLLLGALFCAAPGIAALVYLKTAGAASQREPEITTDDPDRAGMDRIIQSKREEIAALETTVRRRAEECGLPMIPSVQAVSERRIELLDLRKAFEKDTAARDEIARRHRTISGLENKIYGIKKQFAEVEEEEGRFFGEWHRWLDGAGLDQSLSAYSVEKIFTQAERANEKYNEMQALVLKRNERICSIDMFDTEVADVIHACGIPPAKSSAADVQALADALYAEEAHRSAREKHMQESERIRREAGQAEETIAIKKAERNDLLASGHAATRDEFLCHAEAKEQYTACMRRRKEAEHRLRSAAGNPGAYDAFIEQLRQTDVLALKDLNAELSSHTEDIEGEVSRLQQTHGGVILRLRDLESTDEAMLHRIKGAALTGDLNDAAKQWAKLVIARIMLRKGIEKYEKERQPAVFREAERYFRAVTGGRYVRVIRQLATDRIFVEDRDGRRIPATLLSRGTAEQLYLSLRFGYITEYGRHDESLPAVFDDILVNFDPERRQRSCEAIAELSERNQVIFFTCHPDTARMLRDARPDARLIEL
ncbi:AAA family ATPase [Methanogenium sp. S4BF]|uniref:AAA family ATPase n=1 Tax=Methanogenium sp. S4BF TaxID=1789226 RepID=UPI002416A004|nr:AAA family ATPase [Methanogenium sp. S4BF]WFN34345.1 AAA family ATPase [Methanogenium sp. S4BF]